MQARALERAKDRIGKDKYDLKGWKDLVRVISGLGGQNCDCLPSPNITAVIALQPVMFHPRHRAGTAAEALAAKRALYQEVVEVFPTAGEIWARLVEVEVSAGNFEAAKGLFAKCMAQCPSIELYKWYLNVVQEISKARGADGQVQVKKALEHTCEQLGQGPESGELWERYIAFLRGLVPGTDEHRKVFPVPGQEEARQKEVLRKAYHQALSVPHDRLDDLWRGYERFEQEACASADMAKKMVDELLPVSASPRAETPVALFPRCLRRRARSICPRRRSTSAESCTPRGGNCMTGSHWTAWLWHHRVRTWE